MVFASIWQYYRKSSKALTIGHTVGSAMKLSIKFNPFELYLLLIVLFLSAAYLWYTLPKMNDQMRLLIVIISIVLILILGYNLKHEQNIEDNNSESSVTPEDNVSQFSSDLNWKTCFLKIAK